MLKKFTSLGFTALLLSSSVFASPQYIPVVNGNFSTGQWYFEGEKSSMGGNASLTFVPALRFSNKFSVLPTIESNYRGTRSAEELAGGTTLFQDTWENAVSVKGVHGLNERWNVRERAAYRVKWFRETSNETWSDGLYDYNIATLGGEIERHWDKTASVALGYDLSLLKFPNYQSLESSQTGDLSREFAGTNVLDNTIHLLSLRTASPFVFDTELSVQAYYSPRYYSDQHIAKLDGQLSSELREDTMTSGSLTLDRAFRTPARSMLQSSVYVGYTQLDSNQNHYDARLSEFVPNYYDYDQLAMGAQFTLLFGANQAGPMTIDAGYSYSNRDFDTRTIQSSEGTYMSEKLYVNESIFNLGFGYPLSKSFRLRLTSTFGRSKSNNDYESVYRYNYSNANYLFGFSYEY